MSGSGSGSGPGTPEAVVVEQTLASSSVNEPSPQNSTFSAGNDGSAAAAEKTISCISCRGRKLKCDRVKPRCGTCTRLRHHNCEYPERRRNVGTRRRNMRDLEARLAQVETKLVSESAKSNSSDQISWVQNAQTDWDNIAVGMNAEFGGDAFMDQSLSMSETFKPPLQSADLWTQDVTGLEPQEPMLPPADMVYDLHQIYFENLHYSTPMIHKQRYLTSLEQPPDMRPPLCLQYAIWATAASSCDKYSQFEDILYERARKYIDAAEMKDHGEGFPTVQNAQTCGLIATYECRKALFTRSWMTIGRMVRLVQMLGLHRLDSQGRGEPSRQLLPPPKDLIELEERRRTFWVAFHGDRWSSSGTGWAMIIQEKDITTHLPSSEQSFESGILETGICLKDALTPTGVSKISIFGGCILSACLFGHNFAHIHQSGPEDHPEDFANGEFWRRHRTMDNVLSNTFLFLPDNLRLPGGVRDMRTVFLHLNLHTAAICLHQTAIVTAERNNLDPNFIKNVRSRSYVAAEEIVNIVKLVSHVDASKMNPWTGFCLYAAGTVFIQHGGEAVKCASNLSNLEFILAAMKAIGNRHSITTYFTTQLEIDIDESGILGSPDSKAASLPSSGFLAEQSSAPKTIYNLCGYIQTKRRVDSTLKGPLLAGIFTRSDRDSSPRDSPTSAPISNVNSTPSSKHIEAPVDGADSSLSFFYVHPDYVTANKNTQADFSLPTPQYGNGSHMEDFIMFPHDPSNSES